METDCFVLEEKAYSFDPSLPTLALYTFFPLLNCSSTRYYLQLLSIQLHLLMCGWVAPDIYEIGLNFTWSHLESPE